MPEADLTIENGRSHGKFQAESGLFRSSNILRPEKNLIIQFVKTTFDLLYLLRAKVMGPSELKQSFQAEMGGGARRKALDRHAGR